MSMLDTCLIFCFSPKIKNDRADVGYYYEGDPVPHFLQYALDSRLMRSNRHRFDVFLCPNGRRPITLAERSWIYVIQPILVGGSTMKCLMDVGKSCH